MRRFFAFLILLPIPACDAPSADQPTFRGEEECDLCKQQQSEMLEKQKQEYVEYDCSLGTMLSCLDQGLMSEVECEDLVLIQDGQLDTYTKWLQLNEEAQEACTEICEP